MLLPPVPVSLMSELSAHWSQPIKNPSRAQLCKGFSVLLCPQNISFADAAELACSVWAQAHCLVLMDRSES